MLSAGWSRGETQTPYVKSTAKVASDEVDQLRQTLNDRASIDAVAALYKKLSDAVEQGDRASAGRLERPFGDISARLQQQKSPS